MTKLIKNYRSHPTLLTPPSRIFYDDELLSKASFEEAYALCQNLQLKHVLVSDGVPLIFHGVPKEKHNPLVMTKLIKNYRSHPTLLKLPSRIFYDDELLSKASFEVAYALCQDLQLKHVLVSDGVPLIFHGVPKEKHNSLVMTKLIKNYRSHPTLLTPPSRIFYDDELLSKASFEEAYALCQDLQLKHVLVSDGVPLIFHGVPKEKHNPLVMTKLIKNYRSHPTLLTPPSRIFYDDELLSKASFEEAYALCQDLQLKHVLVSDGVPLIFHGVPKEKHNSLVMTKLIKNYRSHPTLLTPPSRIFYDDELLSKASFEEAYALCQDLQLKHVLVSDGVPLIFHGVPKEKHNPLVMTKLIKNYRSHPTLLKLPSRIFYDDELLSKASFEVAYALCQDLQLKHVLVSDGVPLIFHGVPKEKHNSLVMTKLIKNYRSHPTLLTPPSRIFYDDELLSKASFEEAYALCQDLQLKHVLVSDGVPLIFHGVPKEKHNPLVMTKLIKNYRSHPTLLTPPSRIFYDDELLSKASFEETYALCQNLQLKHVLVSDGVPLIFHGVPKEKHNSLVMTKLIKNYRSHPTLLMPPSRIFYDDELLSKASFEEAYALCQNLQLKHVLVSDGVPLIFHGVPKEKHNPLVMTKLIKNYRSHPTLLTPPSRIFYDDELLSKASFEEAYALCQDLQLKHVLVSDGVPLIFHGVPKEKHNPLVMTKLIKNYRSHPTLLTPPSRIFYDDELLSKASFEEAYALCQNLQLKHVLVSDGVPLIFHGVPKEKHNSLVMTKLIKNYRSHPTLLTPPSRIFYDDELLSKASFEEAYALCQNLQLKHVLVSDGVPLIFHGVPKEKHNPLVMTKLIKNYRSHPTLLTPPSRIFYDDELLSKASFEEAYALCQDLQLKHVLVSDGVPLIFHGVPKEKHNPLVMTKLIKNYRSHPTLLTPPSRIFYDDELLSKASFEEAYALCQNLQLKHVLVSDGVPLIFHGVPKEKHNPLVMTKLIKNYRSHPTLLTPPSRIFYDDELLSKASFEEAYALCQDLQLKHVLVSDGVPLIFHGVPKEKHNSLVMTKLIKNYRSHPTLLTPPSRIFYDDELLSKASFEEAYALCQDLQLKHVLVSDGVPLIFHGVPKEKHNSLVMTKLIKNYRSHPTLLTPPSRIFYDDELLSKASFEEAYALCQDLQLKHVLVSDGVPLIFHGVPKEKHNPLVMTKLIKNYRSHPTLLTPPSRIFYDDELLSKASFEEAYAMCQNLQLKHVLVSDGVPLIFHGVPKEKHNPLVMTKLIKNYRSHPTLLKLPSRIFYDDELLSKASFEVAYALCQDLQLKHVLVSDGVPLIFHGVPKEKHNPLVMTKVIKNYRSHPTLLKLPSRIFYDDELLSKASFEEAYALCQNPQLKHVLVSDGVPLIFHGVQGSKY
ncbi:unnamed protein product [Orchesella dallaii]|uniref:Uncharacterized protein n=1 Tax=Orchesella dallaii TaxID=48710 RepID=A0ABP1RKA1_9HEXA